MLFFSGVALAVQTLAPPVFSHASGFYTKDFQLTLNHPDPKVTLYYTLDCSTPELGNLSGSSFQYKNEYVQSQDAAAGKLHQQTYITHLYDESIAITNRRFNADLVGQISTTHDAAPDYLLTAVVQDSWTKNQTAT
ncbi:MAG TPA: chitobiase/beta-hexosaminidase C-terminal domain-containing protein [Thiopseudomonas sp.]|nr:chitobiase/beta-hexosaminidase C-terminal domain-containing protein [Thiopseudomonas sp.]